VNYFYWDASALVKRYAPEIGTPVANRVKICVTLVDHSLDRVSPGSA
jgi:hypothetical protein